ncbi:MAG: mechanosensitive ion channel family protein [Bacteroidales bacterium]|jgi:miniconductance mechanosensitive channel|nr:mechanosensitive ion channel [Bacteroidales bacterium]
MLQWIRTFLIDFFTSVGLNYTYSKIIALLIIAVSLFILGAILYYILRFIILRLVRINISKSEWKQALVETKFFNQVAIFLPALFIKKMIGECFPIGSSSELFLTALINIYIVINCTLIVIYFLNAVAIILLQREGTKDKPIKSYVQIVAVIFWLISLILIVSIIINKSPVGLLAGLGAFSAVLLLVFQDTITGFVSSIQLSTNDIIRNGDWIDLDNFGVSGTVEEVNLVSAKIRNFDNTISTVPVKQLLNNSVKNWRGMQEKEMRRIKRAINIDVTTIKQCTPEMLEKFKKIHLIKDYIEQKEKELEAENQSESALVYGPNGRHLTNVGVLRIYIQEYLKSNKRLRKDAMIMVRQLPPNEYGLPLEIYCFTATTNWLEYENIQSDIFDHILSTLDYFEIRAFQRDNPKEITESKC